MNNTCNHNRNQLWEGFGIKVGYGSHYELLHTEEGSKRLEHGQGKKTSA